MVRRLVEDQEIHFLIHQDAELEARKLAAREHADALKNVLAREVERGQAVARALRRDAALGVEHRVDQVSFQHVEFDDLRQVRDAHRRAELDLALVGIFLFHQHLDERRLARAVVANERDALAAAHLQVHVMEQHTVAEALFELFEREHLVAVELLRLELRAQCPFLRWLVRRAHTLDALFHRQRAAVRLVHALEGKHAQLLGALFKLGNLGLLLFVLAHLFQIAALFFHCVEAVVAAVELRLAVKHLDHARDGAVQKVAVMRDGDDRPLEGRQILLQPFDGVQVQMVRRLVEQQDIRVLQNEAAKVYARLFAARERIEQPLAHLRRDGKAVCDLVDRRFRVVSAEALELGRELTIASQRLLALVAVCHLLREGVHLVLHPLHPRKCALEHILDRVALGIHGDLRDEAQPAARGDAHLARVVVELARQDAEERRLARAVFAEKTHALARVDLKGDTVQYFLFEVKGLDESRNADVDHALVSSSTIFSKCMECEALTSIAVSAVNAALTAPIASSTLPNHCAEGFPSVKYFARAPIAMTVSMPSSWVSAPISLCARSVSAPSSAISPMTAAFLPPLAPNTRSDAAIDCGPAL